MGDTVSISFTLGGLKFNDIPIDRFESVGNHKIAILDYHGVSEIVHQWLVLTKYKTWISDIEIQSEDGDPFYWVIAKLGSNIPHNAIVCINDLREKFYKRFSDIVTTKSGNRIGFNRTPKIVIYT